MTDVAHGVAIGWGQGVKRGGPARGTFSWGGGGRQMGHACNFCSMTFALLVHFILIADRCTAGARLCLLYLVSSVHSVGTVRPCGKCCILNFKSDWIISHLVVLR